MAAKTSKEIIKTFTGGIEGLPKKECRFRIWKDENGYNFTPMDDPKDFMCKMLPEWERFMETSIAEYEDGNNE